MVEILPDISMLVTCQGFSMVVERCTRFLQDDGPMANVPKTVKHPYLGTEHISSEGKGFHYFTLLERFRSKSYDSNTHLKLI